MDKIAETLQNGGVALLPTDTVYGLFASPRHPAAVAGIFALKARPASKKLPIMAASAAQIAGMGAVLDARSQAILAMGIGALTLVLPLANPPEWLANRPEAAFRIPDDAHLKALLTQTGPLFATSANKSGQPTPETVPEILAGLAGNPDIVLDSGPRTGQPSTLIDCQTTPPTVLRRGAIHQEALQEILAL